MIASILNFGGPALLGIACFSFGRLFPSRSALKHHDSVVLAEHQLRFATTVRDLIAEFGDDPAANRERDDQAPDLESRQS